ncbi:tetratricopeptide repeat protein [Streptomyces sp. NPDC059534]|uniref:tetratricopeptide repeat protein n=1 Tax=Streptomyces sp. NPDC059534 TaxID=3346859 RepID=UPI00368F56EC
MTKLLAESGAELSHEELLDALWLAGRLPRGAGSLARAAERSEAARPDAPLPHPGKPDTADPDSPSAEPRRPPRSEHPLLASAQGRHAAGDGAVVPSPAHPVGVPDHHSLGPGRLRLEKSLRPLRQRFPDRRRHALDVPRTVTAMAETGVPETVTRPLRTRWLTLALVVDDGISMVLWQRLAADIRALMERAGSFRDVRVYGLDTRGGTPSLRSSPYSRRSRPESPKALCDPTGNTLVLVVSDGVGQGWRDGGMRRVMDGWARSGPTAIVHALPARLWAGTGITARPWQVTTRSRGGPTRAWHVTDPDLPPELVTFDSVPVPVLAPTPAAVGDWARLIAAPGGTAILPLWDHERTPAGPADPTRSGPARPDGDHRGTGAESVLRFKEAASTEAYRLAAHVAAVAPLTPPVMRLVQAALGPPTDPGHLTEVFLGGLMHEVDPDGPERLPHLRRFDFDADARRALLSAVPPTELLHTAEAVTRRIESAMGRASVFPAWVGHPDGVSFVHDTGRSFGWIRTQLLTRLGIPPSADRWEAPHHDRHLSERTGPDGDKRDAEPLAELRGRLQSGLARARLSKDQLARRAGLGRTTVAAAFQPDGPLPSPRTLAALADVLGLRHEELLDLRRAALADQGAVPQGAPDPGRPVEERDPHEPATHPITPPMSAAPDSDPSETRIPDLERSEAPAVAPGHAGRSDEGILPEEQVLADRERTLGPEHPDTVAARAALAYSYGLAGRFDETIALLERVSVDRERVLGPEHADTLSARADLALSLRQVGRLEEAIALLERVIVDRERVLGGDHDDTRSARTNLAFFLKRAGRLEEALALQERVLVDSERVLGPEHPDTLTARADFAFSCGTAGRTDEAIALEERVLVDRERILGGDHDDTLSARTNLAFSLRRAGRLDEALALQERVLADRERVLGPDHPDTLTSRADLALSLYQAERIDEAIALEERVLADSERVLGPDHPDTFSACASLALSFRRAGRFDEAIALQERVLVDRELVLGPDHPDTLASRADLAFSFRQVERVDEAIALEERVLADRERVLGADHAATLQARADLALSVRQAGRTEEAIALQEQVLAARERVLGREHPDTLAVGATLAFSLYQMGRLDEAIALEERVLADRERVLGPEHADTFTARITLALSYGKVRRFDEAIALQERVLVDSERIQGPEHPDVLTARSDLAVSFRQAGRLDEAIALEERVLADSARVLGPEHPDTLAARADLAFSYGAVGRDDDAIALEEHVLADCERVLGPEHADTVAARAALAFSFYRAGRVDEAVPLEEHVLADRERRLGPEHPNTVTARVNLAFSYREVGRAEEAVALHERVLADSERVLGPEHPDTVIARANLASTYREVGRTEQAVALEEEAPADQEQFPDSRD